MSELLEKQDQSTICQVKIVRSRVFWISMMVKKRDRGTMEVVKRQKMHIVTVMCYFCDIYDDNAPGISWELVWKVKESQGILWKQMSGNLAYVSCKYISKGRLVAVEVDIQPTQKVEIEPNVKLEWVSRFCFSGETLGASGGVWRKQQELERYVLGLSSRSSLPSWQFVVHCII